ncbi:MAG: hypothetical protein CVU12_02010 [Bacteroidetes bacterium HGW-Bacteroidetes-7]|jgi:hypothetical protein|nr:MAG: hypothetical protein CVU12_02010 [Bacteroidetes bacterium HGW-Bacteroidetes-7]
MQKAKLSTKAAFQNWEEHIKSYLADVAVDPDENPSDRLKRIARLEADPESWFEYYFPGYCTSPAAPFHKTATKRLLSNDKWYEVRSWARSLAKSSRAMMEILYLALTKQINNILLVSNSYDNAERLLLPFKINLENNRRIIQDYGEQQSLGQWESGEFVTKEGVSFRALGAGQSPRGTRNKNKRPDFILIDDIDTDEECRNQERIKVKWQWIEEALIPAIDPSDKIRILFCGNVIAKYCCITEAAKKAKYWDRINIRMVNVRKWNPVADFEMGKSVWPEKNKEEDIDFMLSLISLSAALKEYFNNPTSAGDVFKEITYGECPSLSRFAFLVAYADPATSNKDKKGASTKALTLLGRLEGKYYVIKPFLENCSNDVFVSWFYDIKQYVQEKTTVYYYIENNSLQDPFFEQVFKPLFFKKSQESGITIPIAGDTRKKPEKFHRIEGNLEPLNRSGQLIFNEKEKDNPHMKRLEGQFEAFNAKLSSPADGPDSIEGGVWIINNNITDPGSWKFGKGFKNNKKY